MVRNVVQLKRVLRESEPRLEVVSVVGSPYFYLLLRTHAADANDPVLVLGDRPLDGPIYLVNVACEACPIPLEHNLCLDLELVIFELQLACEFDEGVVAHDVPHQHMRPVVLDHLIVALQLKAGGA